MEELKNCKHCGGTAQLREVPGKFRRGWVGCPRCKIYKQWVYDPAEAVRIWNQSCRTYALAPGDSVWFVCDVFDAEGSKVGRRVAPFAVSGCGPAGFMFSRSEDPEAMEEFVPWTKLGRYAFLTEEEAFVKMLAMGGGV